MGGGVCGPIVASRFVSNAKQKNTFTKLKKDQTPKPKQVLREFRETSTEEFCNFDRRSGFPTLCISMI